MEVSGQGWDLHVQVARRTRPVTGYSTALNTARLQRDTEEEPSLATHPREGT